MKAIDFNILPRPLKGAAIKLGLCGEVFANISDPVESSHELYYVGKHWTKRIYFVIKLTHQKQDLDSLLAERHLLCP